MFNALSAYENPGISIFGFKIYAYAIIIVCGMVAAFFVISLLFRRRNMSKDLFLTYFVITLPVALVTTRLFYCITGGVEFRYWFSFTDTEHGIRAGGLSIIGGILGGTASVLLISYIKKINVFRAADCILVGVLLAQAIGRWGNFANQEVYGAEVTNEALQFFPFAVYINKGDGGSCLQSIILTFEKIFGGDSGISGGEWHYAFFFYESILNLTAAVLMFVYAWKNPKKPNGIITAWYFMHYGLVRSIMEPLRDPSYILGDKVQWSFVFSLIMFFAGTAVLIFLLWNNKRKEGALFGSAKGDPYGITEYIRDSAKEVPKWDKINMMCKLFPENYEKPEAEETPDASDAESPDGDGAEAEEGAKAVREEEPDIPEENERATEEGKEDENKQEEGKQS